MKLAEASYVKGGGKLWLNETCSESKELSYMLLETNSEDSKTSLELAEAVNSTSEKSPKLRSGEGEKRGSSHGKEEKGSQL